jgi:hypothetical protein
MLTPEQINEIHRLHFVEKWSQRRIAKHLNIGRHTLAKYLLTPAPPPSRRDRVSKLDAFKPALTELLERDAQAPASVLMQRLQTLGYDGGITIGLFASDAQKCRATTCVRSDGTAGR